MTKTYDVEIRLIGQVKANSYEEAEDILSDAVGQLGQIQFAEFEWPDYDWDIEEQELTLTLDGAWETMEVSN